MLRSEILYVEQRLETVRLLSAHLEDDQLSEQLQRLDFDLPFVLILRASSVGASGEEN